MLFDPKWKPVEIELEPWQKLLSDAADLLDNDGWVRGVLNTEDNKKFCAVGALQKIAFGKPMFSTSNPITSCPNATNVDAYNQAIYALRRALRDDSDIIAWNDCRGRTKQEVVDVFRKAINS